LLPFITQVKPDSNRFCALSINANGNKLMAMCNLMICSEPFSVTNGVRQGGVLSPVLFTVYLELLLRLSKLGIGCHFFGNHFVGGVGYADDVALLASSPSAMRGLLRECETFALEFGLTFNASKTQLIYFRRFRAMQVSPPCVFKFVGLLLSFSDSVNHLGHILHYTLDDTADVARVISDVQKGKLLATCFHWLRPSSQN